MHDLVIIGGGAAGYTASIYASRYKVPHLLVADNLGGLAATAHRIGNWPGETDIDGQTLMNKFKEHAMSLGATIQMTNILGLATQPDGTFSLATHEGTTLSTRALLLATGASHKTLNIAGEKEFLGKGISYCFTCDGFFFRNKVVAVAGGGNSAAHAALYLANLAQQVYLIYRGEHLKAEPHLLEQIAATSQITTIYQTNIQAAQGTGRLQKLILDQEYNGTLELPVDGLFIEVGSVPSTKLAEDVGVELSPQGLIVVQADMSTNIPGIFAAGDVTTGSNQFRQIVTAAAEGAIAATAIFAYLKRKPGI